MRRTKPITPTFGNLRELWDRLGRIPPERIRTRPPVGTATVEDVIRAEAGSGPPCELIDGTLVEKTMGFYESRLAFMLGRILDEFAEEHDLGLVFGSDVMLFVDPGQVRMPDVCFYSWAHFTDRTMPAGQILDAVPDLAIEVLSPDNTKAEMERKRREYFLGGCKFVWEVDPVKKTVRVYTAPDESKLVREKGTLNGGEVLPGFELPLSRLFTRAGKRRA